jgi:hypothetical protein
MQTPPPSTRSVLRKLGSSSAEKQFIKSGKATMELISWVNHGTDDIGLHPIQFSLENQFRKILEVENV